MLNKKSLCHSRGRHSFFKTNSRMILRHTQLPNQWLLGDLFSGVKWPECETDHSPAPGTEILNVWSFTSITPICPQGMVLRQRGNIPYFIWKESEQYCLFCLNEGRILLNYPSSHPTFVLFNFIPSII